MLSWQRTNSSKMSYFKMYGQLRVGERLFQKTLKKVTKEGTKTANVIEKCKKESKLDKNLSELLWEMQTRLTEYEDSLFVCTLLLRTHYHEEIVKCCPKNYPQAKLLMEAYKSICALNADMNEKAEIAKTGYMLYKLGKQINNLPMSEVGDCLYRFDTSQQGFQLIIPTRKFLHQSGGQLKYSDITLPSAQVVSIYHRASIDKLDVIQRHNFGIFATRCYTRR